MKCCKDKTSMFQKCKLVVHGHFSLQRKFYTGGKLAQPFCIKIQSQSMIAIDTAHMPPLRSRSSKPRKRSVPSAA